MPRQVEVKPVGRKAGQPRILLVDDNEELRKAIGSELGTSKFRVTTGYSGEGERCSGGIPNGIPE